MLPEPAATLERDRDHLLGWWHDVLFVVWRVDTTLAAVRGMARHLRRFAASHPAGLAMVVVIEEHSSLPPAESRAELVRLFRDHGVHIHAVAVAMEGHGFRAAAVRSVVTGIAFLIKPTFKLRVFDGIGTASAWLADACGDSPIDAFDGAELGQSLQEVRGGALDRTG